MEAEFSRSLEQLRKQGTLGRLVASALEAVAARLGGIEARLTRIEARLDELEATLHSVAEGLEDHSRQLAELRQKIGNIEVTVGATAEATLSRLTLEALRETGYRVKHYQRNYRIDDEDIDLLVHAERGGEEVLIVVEVKVKPRHSDVGALLAKAELLRAKTGHPHVEPVLAAVYAGREVEAYAKRKGVKVIKL